MTYGEFKETEMYLNAGDTAICVMMKIYYMMRCIIRKN